MAFRKHVVLALALLAVTATVYGCSDDTTAPNTQDETPVLPPTNVRAAVVNGGDVQVSWDSSSQPDVTGYNIYRREVGHGGPQRVNGSRIQATHYIDQGVVVDKAYEYRVTAVNSKGKESRFTAVIIKTGAVIGDGRGGVPIPLTD
jgi:fibronectin type 3 domain-containing protein